MSKTTASAPKPPTRKRKTALANSAGTTRAQINSRLRNIATAKCGKTAAPATTPANALPDRAPRISANTAMATLVALMTSSDKDHVRVSAAKTILAQITTKQEQKMRQAKSRPAKPSTTLTHAPSAERQAAFDAIAQLLDELAATKTARHAGAVAVDQDSAPSTTHAAAKE